MQGVRWLDRCIATRSRNRLHALPPDAITSVEGRRLRILPLAALYSLAVDVGQVHNCYGLSRMWGEPLTQHTTSWGSGNSLFTGGAGGDILLSSLTGGPGCSALYIVLSLSPALIHFSE
jgi:hypothetical protein